MRPTAALILAALALAGLAPSASAQNAELDRLRLQSLQQQNMRAQEQRNAASGLNLDSASALAEQNRLQTRSNLRSLQAARPQPGASGATSDPARIEADEQALRRLQDAELAAGNARLRAITPAR